MTITQSEVERIAAECGARCVLNIKDIVDDPQSPHYIQFLPEQLQAFAQRLQQVPAWQEIENAPKDGRTILVFREIDPWKIVGYAYWEPMLGGGWISGGFSDVPGNLGLAHPTHWMPLPAAPTLDAPDHSHGVGNKVPTEPHKDIFAPFVADLVARMRGFEIDHEPDGWPAIRMRDISALCEAIESVKEPLKDVNELPPSEIEAAFHAVRYDEGHGSKGEVVAELVRRAKEASK